MNKRIIPYGAGDYVELSPAIYYKNNPKKNTVLAFPHTNITLRMPNSPRIINIFQNRANNTVTLIAACDPLSIKYTRLLRLKELSIYVVIGTRLPAVSDTVAVFDYRCTPNSITFKWPLLLYDYSRPTYSCERFGTHDRQRRESEFIQTSFPLLRTDGCETAPVFVPLLALDPLRPSALGVPPERIEIIKGKPRQRVSGWQHRRMYYKKSEG